jgi:hypothetical protein
MNSCAQTKEYRQSKISRAYLQALFCDETVKYNIGANISGYVGTNAEPLCVEFCNFMQRHVLVNYVTS